MVAGALIASEDSCLMHRRPYEKHHGGLWEFPGGKVEDAEIPVKALIRELREELGVIVREEDCEPAGFAEDRGKDADNPIVILLYTVRKWTGGPQALEGGRIDWFDPQGVKNLDMPPLDIELAARLFK
ncbi:(deoxy)nucleoside triphosphate pyrophosphohydrolase [uncultured Erythrobacter sp.]|uniref:(deoxy)nucleoside triphosphate pyrophosphohydrolase n=1 Tax=uncultured Erythrobacter sp. TaxID=263913 RepID=UPI002609E011|nr:(deoxy)nucleoside triphosphate pyrophosphohydrolase [uncultured Erythrobacter sp.]